MFKIIFYSTVFLVNALDGVNGLVTGLKSENNELIEVQNALDQLGLRIEKYGNPNDPLNHEEDPVKLEEMCEHDYDHEEVKNKRPPILSRENIMKYYKGLALKMVVFGLPLLLNYKSGPCYLANKGISNIAVAINKEFNEREGEVMELRSNYIALLTDATKEDTEITWPAFLCYLKIYPKKLMDIFSHNKELSDYIKLEILRMEWLFKVVEKVKGKAATVCQLPVVVSPQPPKFKSVLMALLEAIRNMENK